MRSKSVAVLDIRSSEVCAVVGERGVNNTFIIKSKYTCSYDGYADGELLDEDSFYSAVEDVVKSTFAAVGERISTFHVGIPGEFIKVINTDKVLSFPAPRKINRGCIASFEESSKPGCGDEYLVIRCSPVYYVLSDKRRVIDPVGCVTDYLRGKLCFYLCKASFGECVINAFAKFKGVTALNLIPSALAEVNYLIAPEQRDKFAVLFDLGYISSTYSVACGNGVVYSESFSVGVGHVAALLMSELDIPFEVASAFMSKVNLNAKERLAKTEEVKYDGKIYRFATSTLRDIIREGLDGICETIEECRQSFTSKDLSGMPLYVTGEGLKTIRGTAEHLSSRLVCAVEVIAPQVPYYDKPQFSSLFSLLATALGESNIF